MKTKNILDIAIVAGSRREIEERVLNYLSEIKQRHIVTANPEIITRAYSDQSYKTVLKSADLIIPDGTGLLLVNTLKRGPRMERFTGVALTDMLLQHAEDKKMHIACILRRGGLTNQEQLISSLKSKYPKLSVRAYYADDSDILNKLAIASPHIVLLGLGAPDQDKWIAANKRQLFDCSILVGVGGTFDFISGTMKRAPRPFQSLGLEWLWRLFQKPPAGAVRHGRLKRIITAVIIFPFLALTRS